MTPGFDAGADSGVLPDATNLDSASPGDATTSDSGAGGDSSAALCPGCSGCCDPSGACVPGILDTACGQNGAACVDCSASGLGCAAPGVPDAGGMCIAFGDAGCGPGTCSGCCFGNQCLVGTDLTFCGTDGAACVGCALGSACAGGACAAQDAGICGPQNCVGCCVDGVCYQGTARYLCGQGGEQCQNCGNGLGCTQTGPLGGGTCEGNPPPCPDGCLDSNDVCHPGTDNFACGQGNSPCVVCAHRGSCVDHQCTNGSCNGQNCSGCCDAFGVCHTSFDLQYCPAPIHGSLPQLCVACPAGEVCNASADEGCTPASPCGPSNCTGCCDSTGLCAAGDTNDQCGTNGASCMACAPPAQCLLNGCQ